MSDGCYTKLTINELIGKMQRAVAMLEDCTVCAQACHINRLKGEQGICRGGRRAAVSSYGPHFGEEKPLVGLRGSGTIFFTHCNLKCVFCQNYDISQEGEGNEVSLSELAEMMLELQKGGCHNINLVSPSHYVPQILEALLVAEAMGLYIPIVYNTGGYDSQETLEILDGVVDIYMPDIKFGDDDTGRKYAGADSYFKVVKKAVREMHAQVGDLVLDERGIASRGILVRHLVLPGSLASTEKVMEFLAREISVNTYVNIMGQYFPDHKAFSCPELSRRVTEKEFQDAAAAAKRAGLKRIYAGNNVI